MSNIRIVPARVSPHLRTYSIQIKQSSADPLVHETVPDNTHLQLKPVAALTNARGIDLAALTSARGIDLTPQTALIENIFIRIERNSVFQR